MGLSFDHDGWLASPGREVPAKEVAMSGVQPVSVDVAKIEKTLSDKTLREINEVLSAPWDDVERKRGREVFLNTESEALMAKKMYQATGWLVTHIKRRDDDDIENIVVFRPPMAASTTDDT